LQGVCAHPCRRARQGSERDDEPCCQQTGEDACQAELEERGEPAGTLGLSFQSVNPRPGTVRRGGPVARGRHGNQSTSPVRQSQKPAPRGTGKDHP